tara:strand:+ start:147 stop:365 length:219 start_codon:yes stop_codon:yes gene_type:complete
LLYKRYLVTPSAPEAQFCAQFPWDTRQKSKLDHGCASNVNEFKGLQKSVLKGADAARLKYILFLSIFLFFYF